MKLVGMVAALVLTAGGAFAQAPKDEVQWEVIAVAPTQIIFFDADPSRIDSKVEESTVFTFHVLKAPMAANGQPYTMYLQRTKFSCLEPKMSRETFIAYNDAWDTTFTNFNATPMVPYGPGTVTEDIEIMACDHLNPAEHKNTFSSRKAAVEWARAKFAGN